MRFASLGSGSRGNATVIAAEDTLLLVDCGFTIKEVEQRLTQLDLSVDQLTAVLVTHEHGDHIKGVGALARKYRLPVYSSFGTFQAVTGGRQSLDDVTWQEIRPGRAVRVGAIDVMPVPVPHDAREPCQFVFSHGSQRCGLLTDLGSITPHLEDAYRHCDALLLETNHDVAMLTNGTYSPALKRRVGGDYGHLNNEQSAAFLRQLDHQRLQHLVLSHLSEQNNLPQLALAAIEPIMAGAHVKVGNQESGTGWLVID